MTRSFHLWIWAKNVLWYQKHARARGWLHHAVGRLKRRVTSALMTGIFHCYAYRPRQETKLLAGVENTRHCKGCNTWLSTFKLLLSERDSVSAKQIQLLNTKASSSSPGCFAEGYRHIVLFAKCWAGHTQYSPLWPLLNESMGIHHSVDSNWGSSSWTGLVVFPSDTYALQRSSPYPKGLRAPPQGWALITNNCVQCGIDRTNEKSADGPWFLLTAILPQSNYQTNRNTPETVKIINRGIVEQNLNIKEYAVV